MSEQAREPRKPSMRRQLLLGILLPVLLFVLIDTWSVYRQALDAANTAYDRTLLASAKAIAEELDVRLVEGKPRLIPRVPYAALEAFEADNRSRMFYRVTGFEGEMISGFESLKLWRGIIPEQPRYAALVDFYDDRVDGAAVRVAVLLQPVSGGGGGGMATVQVAETLEIREALARELLVSTLWRQLMLVAVIAAVVLWVVQRAVRPVGALSQDIESRADNDLRPLDTQNAPRELQPLVQANNHLMQRLDHLLQHQKRFVRDTAHQLRTPLAVLKAQTQSAQRGDVPPQQAFREIAQTVDRATTLTNQMLSLAKVEQLRQEATREGASAPPLVDWEGIVRELALELAPLMAERELDFSIETDSAIIAAHEWMLRELTRNLLHNAISHSPVGAALSLHLRVQARQAELLIRDHGPGIDDELRQRLFQPFSRGVSRAPGARQGSGLGLAICAEIVRALEGTLTLDNRMQEGQTLGLDSRAVLALSS